MKTTGLTIQEAVKARREQRCEGFKRPLWATFCNGFDGFGVPRWSNDEHHGGFTWGDVLATDYELVNPIVPTEEREVTGWVIVKKDELIPSYMYENRKHAEQLCTDGVYGDGAQIIEIAIPYRIPVKEKVRKQAVVANAKINNCGTCHYQVSFPQESRGKTGTLTFEWEE